MRENGKGASSQQFRIFETRRFVSDLARLGPEAQRRIEAKLRNCVYPILRENPQLVLHFVP